MAGARNSADFEIVRAAARAGEPDRYLAALLGPRRARGGLVALAAFTGEVNRISRLAGDPHIAEIRLQWWRDAISADAPEPTGNPVADAFLAACRRHALARERIEGWLEALAHTFHGAPPGDEAQLARELQMVEGTPFALAAQICGAQLNEADLRAIDQGALAYGLVRAGVNFPYALARGRAPISSATLGSSQVQIDAEAAKRCISSSARAALQRVEEQYPRLSGPVKSALLPLALVEPYLQALERPGHDLTRDIAEIAPLTRVWRIGFAHAIKRL